MTVNGQGDKLPRSLHDVAPFSTLVDFTDTGRPYIRDKIKTPIDKFGVPQRVKLMAQVLATLEVSILWKGGHNVHHTAWSNQRFSKAHNGLGSEFRECNSLKVRQPSQLHAYAHAFSIEPAVTEQDVMRQYIREFREGEMLADIIDIDSFRDSKLQALPVEQQDKIRLERFQQKLLDLPDPELNVLPDREYLFDLDIESARAALDAVVKVQGFTNERDSKVCFFNLAA